MQVQFLLLLNYHIILRFYNLYVADELTMLLALVYIIVALATALVLYFRWIRTYWKRQGIHYEEPEPLFSRSSVMISDKISPGMFVTNLYNKFKERGWKHGG